MTMTPVWIVYAIAVVALAAVTAWRVAAHRRSLAPKKWPEPSYKEVREVDTILRELRGDEPRDDVMTRNAPPARAATPPPPRVLVADVDDDEHGAP